MGAQAVVYPAWPPAGGLDLETRNELGAKLSELGMNAGERRRVYTLLGGCESPGKVGERAAALVGQGYGASDAVAMALVVEEADPVRAAGYLGAGEAALRAAALEVVARGAGTAGSGGGGLPTRATLLLDAFARRLEPGAEYDAKALSGHPDEVVACCALAVLADKESYLEALASSTNTRVRRHCLIGLSKLADQGVYARDEYEALLAELAAEMDVVGDPAVANTVWSLWGEVLNKRGEVLAVADVAGLCASAPGRVVATLARYCSDADREIIIACSSDWMPQQVAMFHLGEGAGVAQCEAVLANAKADVKAKVAAVGVVDNQELLGELLEARDPRLANAARARLGELRGEAVSPVLTGKPVDAVAVPEIHPKFMALPASAHGGGRGRYSTVMVDVDGTLLDDRESISTATINELRRAHKSGAKVAICTARPCEELLGHVKTLGIPGMLLVCDKGESVVDADSGAVVYSAKPPAHLAATVSEALGAHFGGFDAGTSETGQVGVIAVEQGVDTERVAANAARACAAAGMVVSAKGRGGKVNITTVANKAGAIAHLAEVGVLDLERTLYLGDGDVDVPAFEAVHRGGGTAVALANGAVRVLSSEYVDMLAPDNNSDGVAAALGLLVGERDGERGGEVDLPSVRDYTGYQTQNPSAMREALSAAGLGWVWEQADGVVRAGSISAPGHITYGYPSRQSPIEAAPPSPVGKAVITGVVYDAEAKYCACALVEVDGETTRPTGERYHITLWTAPGVPPAYSKKLIARDDSVVVGLESPVEVELAGFGSWRTH
jgi:hydroxymethylpyrimidine pyrophosphatase-like HAD family hydrolase